MESHKNINKNHKDKMAEEKKNDDGEGEDGGELGCVGEGDEDDDGEVAGVVAGPCLHITSVVGLDDIIKD